MFYKFYGFYTLIALLILNACGYHAKQNPKEQIADDIQAYFDEYYGRTDGYIDYDLYYDSLNINSLELSLYFVEFLASHGTDYVLIRDNINDRIFSMDVERNYFGGEYYEDEIDFLLSSENVEWYYQDANVLEALLNQEHRQRMSPVTIDQLDSILSFNPRREFPRFRYSDADELSDCLTDFFLPEMGEFSFDFIYRIDSLLKNKLNKNRILIYFSENCRNLVMYEVIRNPCTTEREEYEVDKLRHFDLCEVNIKHTEIVRPMTMKQKAEHGKIKGRPFN
ncbi:MAG: hypothetical protein GYB31_21220 [Bacteroidetes bacterium]|nr:hypothetical protein [Bacteroidota bacterium]